MASELSWTYAPGVGVGAVSVAGVGLGVEAGSAGVALGEGATVAAGVALGEGLAFDLACFDLY